MNFSSCTYRIDESDRITYTSPTWSIFAEDNGAPELGDSGIIGRDIWEFIVGEDIRDIYREMFRQVRNGTNEIMFPFRCDSPECIRHMELTMRKAPADSIEFEARLMLSIDREEVPLLDVDAERSKEHVHVCSFCRRFRVDEDHWTLTARQ